MNPTMLRDTGNAQGGGPSAGKMSQNASMRSEGTPAEHPKQRVLLVNPPTPVGDVWVREGRCQQFDIWGAPFPPISLAYVKTQIRDIADTLLLDPAPQGVSIERVMEQIAEFEPDVMIMSTTTPTFNSDTGWFAAMVKERFPDITIGALGIHVSKLPIESLEAAPSIDFVIKGEPEVSVNELIATLSKRQALKDVAGIAYRSNGQVQDNQAAIAARDIDSYGFPDWSDTDFSNYMLPLKDRPFSLISFSRGCPYSCSYCAAAAYYGKKLRERSVEALISEIKYNMEHGVRDFLFWTELLSANTRYLNQFLDALMAEGLHEEIRWVSNSRVDGLDRETVRKMKKAGCWQVAFGLEFGTDKFLKLADKGGRATVEKGRETVELLDQEGIAADGHFILGYPGETEEDMQATIDFAVSLPLTFAHFYIATPFPGSPLYDSYTENRGLDSSSWDEIAQDKYVFSDMGLPEEVVRAYVRKAYRSFYMSPSRMLKIKSVAKGLRENINLVRLGAKFVLELQRQ